MKLAKWLLLVAGSIIVVLSGCKSMSPTVNPDVSVTTTFTYIDPLTTDPDPNVLYAGKNIPCGYVTAYYGYNSMSGGEPVDPYLCIAYQTTGDWRMLECQLDLLHDQPTEKGEPGHYAFKSGDINTTSYTFEIDYDSLIANGWDMYDVMYLLAHAVVYNDENQNGAYDDGEQNETAFPGYITGKKPWFGWFDLVLRPPDDDEGGTEYRYETFWAGPEDNYVPPAGPGGKWYYWFQYEVGSAVGFTNKVEQPMWASQFYGCGTFYVWEADGYIHFQYNCDVGGDFKDGFKWTGLTATHLFAGTARPTSLAPGQFPYKHDPVPGAPAPTDNYDIPNTWVPGTQLYVYAHGVVEATK
jgi:hypothetical protein